MFRQLITKQAKQNLKTLIKEIYKFESSPIQNAQNSSIIGYAHVIKSEQATILKQISKEDAQKLLQQDLEGVFKEVERYWGVVLKYMGDWRMAAIMDATYSCGTLRWPKLTQQMYMQNWQAASEELLDSRYAVQVGLRAKRNAKIIRTGKQAFIQQFKESEEPYQKVPDPSIKQN